MKPPKFSLTGEDSGSEPMSRAQDGSDHQHRSQQIVSPQPRLSLLAFVRFLRAEENGMFDSVHDVVHMDMTRCVCVCVCVCYAQFLECLSEHT